MNGQRGSGTRSLLAFGKVLPGADVRPSVTGTALDSASSGSNASSRAASTNGDAESSDSVSDRVSPRDLADRAARRFRKLDYAGAKRAFDAAEAALQRESHSGKPARLLRSQVLQGRGLVRLELGDVDLALEDLQTAERLCQHLHGDHLMAQARILVNIVKCKEKLGDMRGVREAQAKVDDLLAAEEQRDLLHHEQGNVEALRQWLSSRRVVAL